MGYFKFPPISIDTSGLATEAKQDTIITEIQTANTELGDINTELDNITAKLDLTPVDFFDGGVLDASGTNIPASSSLPLQVVASLASQAHAIQVQDTVGAYIGVYTGLAAAEVLVYVGNPGLDGIIPINIPAGTRISIRNMANVALNLGEYNIVFLG
jgi:hypothetical protein